MFENFFGRKSEKSRESIVTAPVVRGTEPGESTQYVSNLDSKETVAVAPLVKNRDRYTDSVEEKTGIPMEKFGIFAGTVDSTQETSISMTDERIAKLKMQQAALAEILRDECTPEQKAMAENSIRALEKEIQSIRNAFTIPTEEKEVQK